MNWIVSTLLQLPPYGQHRTLDIGVGGLTLASFVADPSTITTLASGASFVYFLLMIGKQVAEWLAKRKQEKPDDEPH